MSQFQVLLPGQAFIPETLELKVTALLREAVISGRLQPNKTLRIHHICKELGVSVTPVNNALKRLEVEGYVAIEPRKGFYIVPLAYEQLEELAVQRVAIECFALEHSIPRMTERDLDLLTEGAVKMEDLAGHTDTDKVEMFALDQEFHIASYKPAARPTLIDTITALRDRCRAYMHLASSLGIQHMEKSQATHWQLISACQKRDVEEAKSLIEGHIRSMLHALGPDLRGPKEKSA